MYSCSICGKTLGSRFNLNRHVHDVHKSQKREPAKNIRCRECSEVFGRLAALRSHLKEVHKMTYIDETIQLEFRTLEEFYVWKEKQEEATNSKWLDLDSVRVNKSGSTSRRLSCCRSGNPPNKEYVPERLRRVKSLGSRKIGGHCTSVMHVFEKNDLVRVKFYKNHYGHSDDHLGHVPLPVSVRKEVAEMLVQGTEINEILAQMRHSHGDQLQRKHFITRKDVHNIKTAYGISSNRTKTFHQNDEFNVDAWVKELEESNPNLVRLYKKLGDECHGMASYDFVVVLMSDFQKRKLLDLGCDRICIDSTFEIACYGLQLTTIFVMDDYEEAFPVAFCLSFSLDTTIIETFIRSIKEVTGPIRCTVFVSDNDLRLLEAWKQVMGPPAHCFLSAWHIDRAWRDNLNTVTDKVARYRVYRSLKACQLQLDEEIFELMYSSLLDDLRENDETIEFSNYLSSTFGRTHKLWAYCYRIGLLINTNMHIENFHKMIGRKSKRIDKFLSFLIHYNLDEAQYHKANVTREISNVFELHREGIKLVTSVVPCTGDCWKVSSSDFIQSGIEYLVVKVADHICDSKCVVRCDTCDVCLKSIICSCPDNAITGNMCEHVHAAMIYRLSRFTEEDEESNNAQWTMSFEDDGPDEQIVTSSKGYGSSISESSDEQIRRTLVQISEKLVAKRVSPIVSKDILEHLQSIDNLLELEFEDDDVEIGEELEFVDSVKNEVPENKRVVKQPTYEFYFSEE